MASQSMGRCPCGYLESECDHTRSTCGHCGNHHGDGCPCPTLADEAAAMVARVAATKDAACVAAHGTHPDAWCATCGRDSDGAIYAADPVPAPAKETDTGPCAECWQLYCEQMDPAQPTVCPRHM